MLFNSFEFVFLVLIILSIYYIPQINRYQVLILIIASLVFYSYNNPVLVLLLLFSVAINVFTSYNVVYKNVNHKKYYAITGVAVNLSILAFFKYTSLIVNLFDVHADSPVEFFTKIPLPIGISFFTFQGISLLVDVFRNEKNTDDLLVSTNYFEHVKKTLFYISFFPQLVAGPIVKASDFLPQIKRKFWKDINWNIVVQNLIAGYFLKMVLADNLKDFTNFLSGTYIPATSSITLVFLLLGYSFQIFSDFAGYSMIAIGISALFGYRIPINFNMPYISISIADFWRRWHISLSSFLKEYLYIPLGGNRISTGRTYANILITMFLGGLWHGAAWSYAIWGMYHGLGLVLERIIGGFVKLPKNIVLKMAQRLFVFSFVSLGWLLFKLTNFADVLIFFKALKGNLFLEDNLNIITYITIYSFPIVLYHFRYLLKEKFGFMQRIEEFNYVIYASMLYLIITNSGTSGDFIYFQF